jgi:hypothetical protein
MLVGRFLWSLDPFFALRVWLDLAFGERRGVTVNPLRVAPNTRTRALSAKVNVAEAIANLMTGHRQDHITSAASINAQESCVQFQNQLLGLFAMSP